MGKILINIKRLMLAIAAILILMAGGFCFWLQGQYVVPVLMYHNVSLSNLAPVMVIGEKFKIKKHLNNVTPSSFEKQMAFLKNHGYQVISLEEYVQGNLDRKTFSHKTVVITFDDGYQDNYMNAFPILKKYHFPATIFLISDFVGMSERFLTWEQIREMSQGGITFGSHTRHHAYVPNLDIRQMKDEIMGSKALIEKNLGQKIDYFAYPSGGFNEQAKAIVALAGYKAALTTNRGYDRYDIDPFEINRIHMNNGDNDFTLATKFSGFYNLFRELKPSH